jgi:hypothetical protein
MKRTSLTAILLAALVGAFYSWVAIQFWASYSVASPFGDWLRTVLSPAQHRYLHLIAIYSHDVVLNVVLAIPFAAMLLLFTRRGSRGCLAAAVAGALVMGYRDLDWRSLTELAPFAGFWMGIAMTVLSLPIALLAVRVAMSHRHHGRGHAPGT